jgi:hypothetical protein
VTDKQVTQPGVNVSSCTGFYSSTIHTYSSYEYKTQIEQGRVFFITCQGM